MRVFGLDLGLNNVGWAVVDKREESCDIVAWGVWIFESQLADENKPTSGLKARDRGEQRRHRRTIDRRKRRKHRLYNYLADLGMLPSEPSERTQWLCAHKQNGKPCDPYVLREEGIRERLELYELGKVLSHINQRRGFLSPRDLMLLNVAALERLDESGEKDDKGQILSEIKKTKEAVEKGGFDSVGEYFAARVSIHQPVRKKILKQKVVEKGKVKFVPVKPALQKIEDQRRFARVDRHMLESEFLAIMEVQAVHHSLLTPAVINAIRQIIFFQRPMGADESTRGNCTFYKNELRIPRASLTAQKFSIVQTIANLSVKPTLAEGYRPLTEAERKQLVSKLMEVEELTWKQAKAAIKLSDIAHFSDEPVGKRSTGKKSLRGSQTVKKMRQAIGEKWDMLGFDAQYDLVGEIISIRDWAGKQQTKPAAQRRYELFQSKSYGPNKVTFSKEEAAQLATVELPSGYLNLCRQVIKRIMPHMLRDCTYNVACEKVGLVHSVPKPIEHNLEVLPYPTAEDIRHPLALGSVRNAVRVLNTLRKQFGQPDAIHLELPRDLARSMEQREEAEKEQRENESYRLAITKRLLEEQLPVNEVNIKKVRLFDETGGLLPYEPDEPKIASLKDLINGPYEIDHIIPRSLTFDNSLGNLTLCTRDFNTQVKSNKILFEAIGHDDSVWTSVQSHVRSIKGLSIHKQRRILAKTKPELDFVGRHLSAIGYISKEILKLAQQMVAAPHFAQVTQGRATGDLRRLWGLNGIIPEHPVQVAERLEWERFKELADQGKAKDADIPKRSASKNRADYRHHMIDALVVALSDRPSLLKVTNYYKLKDSMTWYSLSKEEKEAFRQANAPDPHLRSKAEAKLIEAAIVHRPYRKVSGQLHDEMAKKEKLNGLKIDPSVGEWTVDYDQGVLVRRDEAGVPIQAFPLKNNHHVVIWESLEPNKKGEFERKAEVVPMMEAVRRRNTWKKSKKPVTPESVIRRHLLEPGWRFVMSLCKGDMVEMADGRIGVVSKFSPKQKAGDAEIAIWLPEVAAQLGKINQENPYVIAYIQTRGRLFEIQRRIVLGPTGQVVFSEGGEQ